MLEGKKANIKIGGDFDPIPMDKYVVQVADVNLKKYFNKFKGEEVEMLNYQFVILDEKPMPESKETTRGRYLWHMMSQSLSSKSWLTKLAKAVYGRELTKEEMEKFDPEAIVGKQVCVMVEPKENADRTATYNNIVSYAKAAKLLEPLEVVANTIKLNEIATKPVEPEKPVEVPNLHPDEADPFVTLLEEENAEARDKIVNKLTAEEEPEEEESEEELELKLKLAKAKKAKK